MWTSTALCGRMVICGDDSNVCQPACIVQAKDEVAQVGHGGQVWAPGQLQLESHQIGGQLEKPLQPLRRLMLTGTQKQLSQEQIMDHSAWTSAP